MTRTADLFRRHWMQVRLVLSLCCLLPVSSSIAQRSVESIVESTTKLTADLQAPDIETICGWFEPLPDADRLMTDTPSAAAGVNAFLSKEAAERAKELEAQIESLRLAGDADAAGAAMDELIELLLRFQPTEHWRVRMAKLARVELNASRNLSPAELERVRASMEDNRKSFQLRMSGQYLEAADIDLRNIESTRNVTPLNSAEGSILLSCLATDLQHLGQPALSERLLRFCVGARHAALGAACPILGDALNSLAISVGESGDYRKAEPLARAAVKVLRDAYGDEDSDLGSALNTWAIALSGIGDNRRALQAFELMRAVATRTFGPMDPRVALATQNFAKTLVETGEYGTAERLFRHAIDVLDATVGEGHPFSLIARVNLAHCLAMQGELVDVRETLEGAISGFQTLGMQDSDYCSGARLALADAALSQGNLEEALRLFQELVRDDVGRGGEMQKRVAQSQKRIGEINEKQGDRAAAETCYRRAVKTLTALSGERNSSTLSAAARLGMLLISDADPARQQEGVELVQRVIDGQRSENLRILAETVADYADGLRRLGRMDDALRRYQEAIEEYDRLRAHVGGGELRRAGFGAHSGISDIYSGLSRAVRGVHANSTDQSACAQLCLSWIERGRAKSLAELLSSGSGIMASSPDAPASRPWADMETALGAAGSPGGGTDGAHFRAMCDALRAREIVLSYDIGDEDSILMLLAHGGEAQLFDLRWPDGEPLTRESLRACIEEALSGTAESGGGRERTRKIAAAPRPAADLSRSIFPDSVRAKLRAASRVIVIPDGELCGLPLDSLTLDATSWIESGPPIVVAPSLAVMSMKRGGPQAAKPATAAPLAGATRALVALGGAEFAGRQRSAASQPTDGVMVASIVPESVADRGGLRGGDIVLDYDGAPIASSAELGKAIQSAEEARGPAATQSSDAEPKRAAAGGKIVLNVWRGGKIVSTAVEPGRLGVRLSNMAVLRALRLLEEELGEPAQRAARAQYRSSLRAFAQLVPLPGSETEVAAIASQFRQAGPPEAIRVLSGSEATVPALQRAADRPRFLHLATHALIDGGAHVWESALALTQPADPTPEDTGFLRLADLLSKWGGKLDGTDLVVLSACQTARGRYDAGEGFVGLTWGFLYAGAESVIASLWKVDDAATVLLMNRLYENLLGNFNEPRMGFAAKTPMPKAEALHEAKRWLRSQTPAQNRATLAALGADVDVLVAAARERGGRLPSGDPQKMADSLDFSHPRFWAAFILVGSPD